MVLKNLKCLQLSALNDEMFSLLPDRHQSLVLCICGKSGYQQFKKLIWETLWRFEVEVLVDCGLFFALQELYDFSELINLAIEVKTLEFITRHLNIRI